jgi:cob(I)alamin adenosyltransferase
VGPSRDRSWTPGSEPHDPALRCLGLASLPYTTDAIRTVGIADSNLAMKIYTRSGDDGFTGLYGGGRVLKCDSRIEAIGAVDELNAHLGIVRTLDISIVVNEILGSLQNRMFDLGAELATNDPGARGVDFVRDTDVDQVEKWIDEFESRLPALQTFILPGGSPAAATLHLARVVCRRAERRMVELAQSAKIRKEALQYINRVGDLLFVLARSVNADEGLPDIPWQKSS